MSSDNDDFLGANEFCLIRIWIVRSIRLRCDLIDAIVLSVEQNHVIKVIVIITGQDRYLSVVDSDDGWVVSYLKDVRRGLNQLPGVLISLSATRTLHSQSLN